MATLYSKPLMLFIFCNDRDSYLNYIGYEKKSIRKIVKFRLEKIEMEYEIADYSEPEEVLDIINKNIDRIILIHFSGHSNHSVLQLDEGVFFGNYLSEKLLSCKKLKLAFFNGCNNKQQLEKIIDNGSFSVVGTNLKIQDKSAYLFCKRFYEKFIIYGFSVNESFDDALLDNKILNDDSARSIELASQKSAHNKWFLTNPDASWFLKDSVSYINKIPSVKEGVLPNSPYKDLISYDQSDVEIFAGRSEEIYKFFEIINNFEENVIILHGQSGVGKSSFLKAGLIPRFETEDWEVKFFEINQDISFEFSRKNKGIIFLDQVESLFFTDEKSRLDKVFNILSHFDEICNKKKKIVFSLRTEWFGRFESLINDFFMKPKINFILGPLDRSSIVEIISYPEKNLRLNKKYRINFKPKKLIDLIASDVLSDGQSNIAPTLQCILYEMWLVSKRKSISENNILFTKKNYLALRKEGIALGNFLNKKISNVTTSYHWGLSAFNSGLIYSVLVFYTNELGVSKVFSKNELYENFEHVDIFPQVNDALIKNHLVIEVSSEFKEGVFYRLSHDSLAPLIIKVSNNSMFKAQSLIRILSLKHSQYMVDGNVYLNERDLALLSESYQSIPKFSDAEKIYIGVSKGKRRAFFYMQEFFLVIVFFISFLIVLNYLWGAAHQVR